jgi:membrane protein involved in colicin uptake
VIERHSLLLQGLREQSEQFAADQQRVAEQREKRYDQIAGRLMTEQAYLAAKEEEQARIEAYEKAAIANLSREVVEARRAEYLKNTTRSVASSDYRL